MMEGSIFINFTNHASVQWEAEQKRAATKYGEIVDIPFPAVDSRGDETYIKELAGKSVESILAYRPRAVLCQGEYCLVYQVVSLLKRSGITVVAACSERCVQEKGNRKEIIFQFTQFREY